MWKGMVIGMSLENITGKIVSEANEFASAVIAEAQTEATAILEEYEATAEKEYNQIIDTAYEKASEIMHRSNAQSMKEKRINILSAKWEYLSNAFSAAVSLLCRMPDEKQVSFLTGLVRKYQQAEAEIIFNKADRERIGHLVEERVNAAGGFRVTLSESTGDFLGGLVLKEGGVEANLTYETLVASCRESLEDEVSSILFEQE